MIAPQALESLPDLLTIAEAAEYLRLSKNGVYALARDGELPSVRLGRRVVIPKRSIERLIEEAR